MPFLTATAELGSSRTTGKQHVVHVRNGERSLVVAGNLSRHQAEELAGRLNALFSDRPQFPPTCASCGTALLQPPSGRPRRYCSPACSQAAYRKRRKRATLQGGPEPADASGPKENGGGARDHTYVRYPRKGG